MKLSKIILRRQWPQPEVTGKLYIPEEFIKAPELLIPGKKPISNFKIDWSNPLTEGMVRFFIINQGKLRDLVRNKEFFMGPYTQYRIDPVQGEVWHFNDSYYNPVVTDYYPSSATKTMVMLNSFDDCTDGGSDPIHFMGSLLSGGRDLAIGLYNDETIYRGVFRYGSVSFNVPNTYTEDDKPYLTGMTFKEDESKAYVFIDGEILSSFSTTWSAGASSRSTRFGGCNYYTTGTGRGIYGNASFLLLAEREWTDADHYSFYRDPYQILKAK